MHLDIFLLLHLIDFFLYTFIMCYVSKTCVCLVWVEKNYASEKFMCDMKKYIPCYIVVKVHICVQYILDIGPMLGGVNTHTCLNACE